MNSHKTLKDSIDVSSLKGQERAQAGERTLQLAFAVHRIWGGIFKWRACRNSPLLFSPCQRGRGLGQEHSWARGLWRPRGQGTSLTPLPARDRAAALLPGTVLSGPAHLGIWKRWQADSHRDEAKALSEGKLNENAMNRTPEHRDSKRRLKPDWDWEPAKLPMYPKG